jgi:hypothetical protein
MCRTRSVDGVARSTYPREAVGCLTNWLVPKTPFGLFLVVVAAAAVLLVIALASRP